MFTNALNNIIINSFQDAASELLHILPLLFVIFVVIELIEYFYLDKISSLAKHSGSFGPFFGALLASFPQCGFSIIASVLYIRGFITRGTLLAVYLSTSDEAIPVLLSAPHMYKAVGSIVLIKIVIGVCAGYLIDFIFKPSSAKSVPLANEESQEGCCHHDVVKKQKKDLILHPIKHTIIISIFIFVMTFFLNILISGTHNAEALGRYLMIDSPIQPVMAAFFGLIPNCAVSVAFIMLFIKGSITFASVISGLCANAGLGIWVILTKNANKKDSIFIVVLLFVISSLAGLILSFIQKFI